MQVVIPTTDFHFSTSPRSTSPSTPKGFGHYSLTAPNSPARISEFYRDFDNEFAFHFNLELGETALPADELFESGKIRSQNPPTRFVEQNKNAQLRTEQERGRERNPSIENTGKRTEQQNRGRERNSPIENTVRRTEQNRGRERNPSLSSSNSARRGARSQSPDRVSKYPWEEQEITKNTSKQTSYASLFSKIGSKKWRLKDFFLFRSASEGRKYTVLLRKQDEAKGFSSFRAIEGSTRKGGQGNVSAHELHYTMNRAVSEDLKKKTFLPYKQGIVGKLAFNPAVHALANGFGFSSRK